MEEKIKYSQYAQEPMPIWKPEWESNYKKTGEVFPVKYCLECKRAWEVDPLRKKASDVYYCQKWFPTFGLIRRTCKNCKIKKGHTMKFTETEMNKLYDGGFRLIPSIHEFRNTLDNGDYQTVTKNDTDDFDYHYDVNDSSDDIDRANNGISEHGLTWDEMWMLL